MKWPPVSPELDAWLPRLDRLAADHIEGADGSHDLAHLRRVWANARSIMTLEAEPERIDALVLAAGCYLHDLVNLAKDDPARHEAAERSADAAGSLLVDAGFPVDRIPPVQHAIRAHSFSAGIEPESREAEILQDADRIEALGAIGVARCFYTAGQLDSALFAPEDPAGDDRPLDDRRYALDHFRVKLLRLPDSMRTAGGRSLAMKRAAFMVEFRKQLLAELLA